MQKLQTCFGSSENALNQQQIPSDTFKNVFVHTKTLKINGKYHPKASKVFSSIRKRLKTIANSMQMLQKCFRSSENSKIRQKNPSEGFKCFLFIRECLNSIANTIRRLQMYFHSSENALNRQQIPSKGLRGVFVHPKTPTLIKCFRLS